MFAEMMRKGRKPFAFTLALLLVLGQLFLIKSISPAEAATDEAVVVIGEQAFSLAELQAVPAEYQIEADYQYNSKGGLKTAHVKGVDLWYLLNTVVGISDPAAEVRFICSDGYPVDLQTQADLANPDLQYVLAWEVDGQPVSDDDGNALLRIYRQQKTPDEFNTVFKAIVAVEIENGVVPTEPVLKVIKLTVDQKEASVDGESFTLDAAPYIDVEANRTLVPLRFISENVGADVDWDPQTKQVTIIDAGKEIILTIGSQEVLVGGEEQTIDCAPLILPPNRTFVPLRFVIETLGAKVDYEPETKEITITK